MVISPGFQISKINHSYYAMLHRVCRLCAAKGLGLGLGLGGWVWVWVWVGK